MAILSFPYKWDGGEEKPSQELAAKPPPHRVASFSRKNSGRIYNGLYIDFEIYVYSRKTQM